MTSAHIFVVGYGLSMLVGCTKQGEQHISVVVTREGSPAVGAEVRLYNQENCQGSSYARKSAGSSGWVEFNVSGGRGDDHPIEEQLSVCAEVQGAWQPLLSTSRGADPKVIELRCEIAGSKPQCVTNFDERPQEQGQRAANDS